jgi:fibronectin type III domain protein
MLWADASKTLKFSLRQDDLDFVGQNNKPSIEPGEFEVRIEKLVDKFKLLETR